MLPYHINLALITLYAIIFHPNFNLKRKKIFLSICFLQLFLLSALRSFNVGQDVNTYVNYFYNMRKASWQSFLLVDKTMECGYAITNKIISIFTGNAHILLAIFALLLLSFLCKSLLDNSQDVYLSLYLYITIFFFYQSFNQIRQMLAFAIILYGYKYIRKNNLFLWSLWVFVAFTFHFSSIIVFPLYFLRKITITKKTIIIYAVGTITSIALFQFIGKLMLSKIPRYAPYFSSEYYYDISMNSILNLIFRISMVAVLFLFYKQVISINRNNLVLYHSILLLLCFQIFSLNNSILSRIPTYFFGFIILLIPEVIHLFYGRKAYHFIYAAVVISFFVYNMLYFNTSTGISSGVVPYKVFLHS